MRSLYSLHPCTVLLSLLLLLLFSFVHVGRAVVATPVVDCWKAMSYDMCTVQDSTGICASKFQQDVVVDADYRKNLFNYLVERYTTQTVGTSIEGIIAATLSPTNGSYASHLDSTYGSLCNSDAGVAALLSTSVSESNAETSRFMWLLILQQATFCSANEIWVLNTGCVCKEDKDCDELSASEHKSLLQAVALVLAIFIVIQIFTYVSLLRQIWAIFGGYDAVKSAIEFLASTNSRASSSSDQASSRQKKISSPMMGEPTRRATPSVSYSQRSPLHTSPSLSSLPMPSQSSSAQQQQQVTRKIVSNPSRPSPPAPAYKSPMPKIPPPVATAVVSELHNAFNIPPSPFDE